MFAGLTPPAPDGILALMQAFRDDPRPGRIDLGVGVWRDGTGRTPVMRAVREAERRLWESGTTKTYTALAGEPAFAEAMGRLILGEAMDGARLAAAATPGGTGAIRQGLELVRHAAPDATVWVSEPTWPNHLAILGHLGMPVRRYRWLDPATREVDTGAVLADLGGVAAGDVVLLHGCCHNPTGADLTPEGWAAVARLLAARGAVPFIDLAYQGFGDGLEADAAGTRAIAAELPEVLIAASCSKNFGLYRERAGILIALVRPADRAVTQDRLAWINRVNFSFPPDHGARVVTTILGDPALRADWQAELDGMRGTMVGLRAALAEELRRVTNSGRFDFIGRHRGMFSLLGATPEEVERLRTRHAIYMVGDSRMNIAGLHPQAVPVLARAIADSLRAGAVSPAGGPRPPA